MRYGLVLSWLQTIMCSLFLFALTQFRWEANLLMFLYFALAHIGPIVGVIEDKQKNPAVVLLGFIFMAIIATTFFLFGAKVVVILAATGACANLTMAIKRSCEVPEAPPSR